MNTSDILNKAADLIEERGWVSGTDGMRVGGPHCMEGAIQAASGGGVRGDDPRLHHYLSAAPCPAGDAVQSYLNIPSFARIFEWNDAPHRTAAEVVEVLRACAVIESARERETAAVS